MAVGPAFTKKELEYLQTHAAPLMKAWGYRMGRDGAHVRYESKTHELRPNYILQNYTDLLFRTLDEGVAFEHVLLAKMPDQPLDKSYLAVAKFHGREVDDSEEDEVKHEAQREREEGQRRLKDAHRLLIQFYEEPSVRDNLKDLADQPFGKHEFSLAWNTVVLAAQALLLLIASEYQQAFETIRFVPDCLPAEEEGEEYNSE